MSLRRPTALVVACLAAALAFTGCGGDDERTIPNDTGATLLRLLRDARDQAGDPDRCDDLQRTVSRLQAEVQTLPDSLDEDTRLTLVDGVDNLAERAETECEGVETETTPTTETVPPPTTTEEAPPPTTTEEEPPPTTTEEEPPPPKPEPPEPELPEQGEGNSGPGSGGVPPGQQKNGKGKKSKGDKG